MTTVVCVKETFPMHMWMCMMKSACELGSSFVVCTFGDANAGLKNYSQLKQQGGEDVLNSCSQATAAFASIIGEHGAGTRVGQRLGFKVQIFFSMAQRLPDEAQLHHEDVAKVNRCKPAAVQTQRYAKPCLFACNENHQNVAGVTKVDKTLQI